MNEFEQNSGTTGEYTPAGLVDAGTVASDRLAHESPAIPAAVIFQTAAFTPTTAFPADTQLAAGQPFSTGTLSHTGSSMTSPAGSVSDEVGTLDPLSTSSSTATYAATSTEASTRSSASLSDVAVTPRADGWPARVRFRAGFADWASLVLAVLVPPVGLVMSIIVRIVSWRRRSWTSAVARTATVLGSVFTILALVAGVILSSVVGDALDEAAIVSNSAPLCTALAETPGVLDAPAYGWPTEPTSITDTLASMKLYQERWQGLADIAPAQIRAGVTSVASSAQTLVTSVETTRSIDRRGNLAQMSAITAASGLPAFVAKYCG